MEGNADVPDIFAAGLAWRGYQTMVEQGVYSHYQRIDERPDPCEVVSHGRRLVMAGSNDYLALSTDPRLKSAAVAAVRRFGTGNSGSRPANGTLALHEELEGRLAGFLRQEAAMVVTTGFQANLALSPLFGPHDVLLADRHVHASLIEAARLGRSRLRRYAHNDLTHLEHLLDRTDPAAGRLILTEGMFSTTGDLCDLPGVGKLAQRYGARLAVDGAHDIGLLGDGGGGIAEHHGWRTPVDLQTLTFSKCFGTVGGAVAGPEQVIVYLRHHAPAALFSASLPAASAAAALAALDIIRAEPERRHRAMTTAGRLARDLAALGFRTAWHSTPIIPVHIGDTVLCRRFCCELLNEGVFTTAMVPPAVPDGQDLIRLSVTAAHTDEHVDRILRAFAAAGRRLHVIG
ncbi:MAG TPA: pyridoxal phosphate-dependent aminotransferase family protein [Thermomonospora sp.]|nr:pyridoxal phosphate-dependent aminotransferase family protein [Thermomonospora sp.]